MAVSKSLMYWEEEGVNCYEQSYDNPILETTESYITLAIEHLDIDLGKGGSFHVTDYGTADGSLFVNNISLFTDKIGKKFGKETEIMIYLEDLPLNDFKSVWWNVDTLGNPSGVYFATSAVSFYKQCFPKNSIHLGVTSAATHWFSDSNFIPRQSFIPNASTDQDTIESAMELSEKDWEQFLLHRSEELVKGGVLLCLNFAIETEVQESVWMEAEFIPLNKALRQVYEKGYLDQEEYDNCGVPFLFRTEEQHKRPFLNCDSKVSKSGLKLLHFESRSCTFLEAYKKEIEGKISPENEEEVLEHIAQKRCDMVKVIYSNHFYKALKPKRKEQEKQKIVNMVLENYKEMIKQNRFWLTFPNDVHYHFMIIKKDGVIHNS